MEVRREGAHDHQIDVVFVDLGGTNRPPGRFGTHLTGRFAGGGMAAALDARPLFDPARLETVFLLQFLIADDRFRHVRASAHNLHAHQGLRAAAEFEQFARRFRGRLGGRTVGGGFGPVPIGGGGRRLLRDRDRNCFPQFILRGRGEIWGRKMWSGMCHNSTIR